MLSTVVCLFMLPCVVVASPGDEYEVIKTTSLRNGPHVSHLQLASLYAGDRLVELTRKGDWIRVRAPLGNSIGWVPERVLKLKRTTSSSLQRAFERASIKPQAESSMPALTGSSGQQMQVVSNFWRDLQPEGRGTGSSGPLTPTSVRISEPKSPVVKVSSDVFVSSELTSPDVSIMPVEMSPVASRSVRRPSNDAHLLQRAVEMLLPEQEVAPALQPKQQRIQPEFVVPEHATQVHQQTHPAMPAAVASLVPEKTAVESIQQGSQRTIQHTTAIRSGPGALYGVLGWAGTGADVVVDKQQGEWANVHMLESKRSGWVKAVALQKQTPTVFAIKPVE